MLVPRSWLADFAPALGDMDAVALGEALDNLGMVVEGITRVGEGLGGVVVARVESIHAIPGADKIRQVFVDAGGPDPVEVVCGAWNFHEGDLVPLATVGAVLPGNFEIARRKMKGVTSNGMLCSGRELNLGDDHSGILVLPATLEVGTPFAEAMGITADVVYDLAIESNRPDAMCVAGVARDVAAKLNVPFAIPEPPAPPALAADDDTPPRVEIDDFVLCPRFTATVLTGFSKGASPEWLARRLTLAGMRPINAMVDASNYVMLELGQPTHPYDLDKLPHGGLKVRAARPGETLTTLDGVERTLGNAAYPDALICDLDDVAVGIAGIMGGASSEIDEGTTRCLLEAAYFDRMSIARTSKRLGLRSEASARFERGTDPEGIERSVRRIAELVGAHAGAIVTNDSPAHLPDRTPLRVRVDKVNALLGTDLRAEQMQGLLAPIGFTAADGGDGTLTVDLPSWRPDAALEVDVAEEVARHHGYANIARTVPKSPLVGGLSPFQRLRRTVRQILVGAGATEAVTGMLVGPGDHAKAGLPEGPDVVIEAVDPLAKEESVLRTSLRPGLLEALSRNASHRNADVALFEVGHVYRRPLGDDGLPDEREALGLAAAGRDATYAVQVLRTLTDALRIDVTIEQPAHNTDGLHPTRTASVEDATGAVIGVAGEFDPDVVAAHGLDGRVAWLGIDMAALAAAPRRPEDQRPVSRFPSSDLDLAFVVRDGIAAASVEATLREAGGDLLERVALFDVYRGRGVDEGSRSLAFRLRFCAVDRTLTDADLTAARQACIDAVTEAHGASLRG